LPLVLLKHLKENLLAGFLSFGGIPEQQAAKPVNSGMMCLVKLFK
jgi:hypothetical protein